MRILSIQLSSILIKIVNRDEKKELIEVVVNLIRDYQGDEAHFKELKSLLIFVR